MITTVLFDKIGSSKIKILSYFISIFSHMLVNKIQSSKCLSIL